jgi:deoxyribodipyrimidine photo-lyase
MKAVLWWIRRDMRLTDNQALQTALQNGGDVLPVFILDPMLLQSPYTGEKRLTFMHAGLNALDKALKARGSYLILRHGNPLERLKEIVVEASVDKIYAEEDYSPYATQRDAQIAHHLPLELLPGRTIHHPAAVLKADGSPFTVFTPYSRRWKDIPALYRGDIFRAPEMISTPKDIPTETIPPNNRPDILAEFPAGEAEAARRLQAFTDGDGAPIANYTDERNRMDHPGTSQLSPYLRFGMLSPRQAAAAAHRAIQNARDEDARTGAEVWLDELIWRDFFTAILHHFPHVMSQSFRSNLRSIRWRNREEEFVAWCEGRTGYPIVDAAMRQLLQSGWMHNRARMIVASFLVKDLLVDWRWGERWFMQQLLDGDPASNNGGWQWSAGTGTDAAPYFRIFNPILQSRKFDPSGRYIQHWVPELAKVPAEYIHGPWSMPSEVQDQANCVIHRDYPAPIVDHKFARERALETYALAREESL